MHVDANWKNTPLGFDPLHRHQQNKSFSFRAQFSENRAVMERVTGIG